jgi:hypothetical protein
MGCIESMHDAIAASVLGLLAQDCLRGQAASVPGLLTKQRLRGQRQIAGRCLRGWHAGERVRAAAGTHPHAGPDFVACSPQLLHDAAPRLACRPGHKHLQGGSQCSAAHVAGAVAASARRSTRAASLLPSQHGAAHPTSGSHPTHSCDFGHLIC